MVWTIAAGWSAYKGQSIASVAAGGHPDARPGNSRRYQEEQMRHCIETDGVRRGALTAVMLDFQCLHAIMVRTRAFSSTMMRTTTTSGLKDPWWSELAGPLDARNRSSRDSSVTPIGQIKSAYTTKPGNQHIHTNDGSPSSAYVCRDCLELRRLSYLSRPQTH
ncbi:uncharacterized protein SCHCODRAFT_02192438 [Schizophyllum commune H4-8]|uniref:uncharacterized protein n=1 Tax=Schizophyllum commune (strain H4-8 / FGSC 9210) TaxID=578458 RepID=UPI00215F6BAB|nr:uncharacterized protein SCHCODRAFT_02192438 [Schizophyllum commune H4-8]KAI5896486.1 hypothetical protein SCHCODRAFT_02192438 [Schizophyllum commune H4-8]